MRSDRAILFGLKLLQVAFVKLNDVTLFGTTAVLDALVLRYLAQTFMALMLGVGASMSCSHPGEAQHS